jgi:hypothetical protein
MQLVAVSLQLMQLLSQGKQDELERKDPEMQEEHVLVWMLLQEAQFFAHL